jgi:YidC/Oxa1 family membrane protein insertase
MLSALMSVVYSAISADLLFWHSAWAAVLGDPHGLATDWAWVLGIVLLVLTVRAVLLPIYARQARSQRALQRLQPRIKELQAAHKGDTQRLSAELSKLYRAEQTSPFGGFLPMLVQIPVFLGLLHVLRHLRPTVTGTAARTLYGWSAAQFDNASHARLFGAPIAATFHSGGVTVMLVAAVLIAAMITTTFVTSLRSIRATGWSENPQQRTVQRLMLYGVPCSLLVSGAVFPIGVVLYWTTQNLFALAQQTWLNRRYPAQSVPAVQPTQTVQPTQPSAAPQRATTTPKVGAKPTRPKRV